MKKLLLKGVLLCAFFSAVTEIQAQVKIYSHGTIQYERKTNSYRLAEEIGMGKYFKDHKFSTDTFALEFDTLGSRYFCPNFKPEESNMSFSFGFTPDLSTVIYKNHLSDSSIAFRQIQEERIALVDSFRNIQWTVTEEFREIAGFQCQKFVGVLFDSVYIVAFVTNQISVNDGPETFAGLPGMIMGLAVPRLFTTWMAISYTEVDLNPYQLEVMPKKKFVFNHQNFDTFIRDKFSDWGTFANLYVWAWGL